MAGKRKVLAGVAAALLFASGSHVDWISPLVLCKAQRLSDVLDDHAVLQSAPEHTAPLLPASPAQLHAQQELADASSSRGAPQMPVKARRKGARSGRRRSLTWFPLRRTAGSQPPGYPKRWPPRALEGTPLPNIDAMVRAAGVTTERPFLLIGVLSSRRTYRRRVTVRATWARFITHTPTHTVQLRFVLGADEVYKDDGVTEDSVLYVRSAAVTYTSIMLKVFVMLEHAAATGARWLLKTDDDAYVNIPQTVANLLTLCTTAECDAERSYVGTFVGGAAVFTEAGHKWHNAPYLRHTHLETYLPYALGGGYILSLDVVRVLVELHARTALVFTTIEDANVGMWLAGMNVTLVNWSGPMVTAGWTCCFTRSRERGLSNEVLGRYSLSGDPCKPKKAETGIAMRESALEELRDEASKQQSEEAGERAELGAAEGDGEDVAGRGDEVGMRRRGARMLLAQDSPGGPLRWLQRVLAPRSRQAAAPVHSRGGADGVRDLCTQSWASRFAADAQHSPGTTAARAARALQQDAQLSSPGGAFDQHLHDAPLPPFQPVPRRNSSAPGESRGASVIFSDVLEREDESGERVSVWRTRPMILHKVANPLHMHYLQWRLTHCGIPQSELLTESALDSAAAEIPAVQDIFHVSYSVFAHGAKGGTAKMGAG